MQKTPDLAICQDRPHTYQTTAWRNALKAHLKASAERQEDIFAARRRLGRNMSRIMKEILSNGKAK